MGVKAGLLTNVDDEHVSESCEPERKGNQFLVCQDDPGLTLQVPVRNRVNLGLLSLHLGVFLVLCEHGWPPINVAWHCLVLPVSWLWHCSLASQDPCLEATL